MDRRTFLLFVSPSIVVMLLLMVAPLVAAVILGFHSITLRNVTSPQWIGLDNYIYMLTDAGFWNAFQFTLLYSAVTVPIQILLGLVVALLLDQVRTFRGIYMAATLLPFIVTPIVGTLVFRQAFDRYGILNYFLNDVVGLRSRS